MEEKDKKTLRDSVLAALAGALGYALFGKVGLIIVAIYVVAKKL